MGTENGSKDHITYTKILEQIGKKRFTGKIRNSYFNELKEQLDTKRRKRL